MALNPVDIRNFETLRRAYENGDLALLECTRADTGETVAAITAVQRSSDGGATFTPFAIMLNDPFTELNPPEGASYVPL